MQDFKVMRINLSQQIADHLENEILSPKYDINDKLPSEQALAEEFLVSRTAIREALKLLTERGLVIQKNGYGAFVSKPDVGTIFRTVSRMVSMNKIDGKEIYQVRIALEVETAGLAAEKHTKEDLKSLENIIKRTENPDLLIMDRVKLDIELHNAVAKASGNRFLMMFVEVMMSLMRNYFAKGVVIQGGIQDAVKRHKVLLEAIKSGNRETARKAMLDHLKQSQRNVEKFDSSDNPDALKISDFLAD